MLGRIESKKNILILIIVGLAIIFLVFLAKTSPNDSIGNQEKIVFVDVIDLEIGENQSWIYSQGELNPKTKITLSSQVSGRVSAVSSIFESGGFFNSNEVLLNIEDYDYSFALSQAEANLASAIENLSIEKGRSKQARQEWRDLGDKESNDLFLRRPQLDSAISKLKAAESQLSLAKINLSRTSVSLPYDGFILNKFVDLGQFVSVGMPIAEVYNSAYAEITLPIKANDRLMIDLNNKNLEVFLYANYGNVSYEWVGELNRLEAKLDDITKQYNFVVAIDDPFLLNKKKINSQYKPPLAIGQFLKAKIPGNFISDSFYIPKNTLRVNNKIWILVDEKLKYLDVDVIGSEYDSFLVKLKNNNDKLNKVSLIVSDLSVAYPGMLIKKFSSISEKK